MTTRRLALSLLAALTLPVLAAPSRAEEPGHAVPLAADAPAGFDAAKGFVTFGCSGCHGDDGIYRDEIKGALGKPVDQVARWIRNAPSIKPGTDMPSFDGIVDGPASLALAKWVQHRAATLK